MPTCLYASRTYGAVTRKNALVTIPPPRPRSPGLLGDETIWFLAVGWWGAALLLGLAFALMGTIVGIPAGRYLCRCVPTVLLRRRPVHASLPRRARAQIVPLWGQALWMLSVGWLLAIPWLVVGYLLCLGVITMPAGLYMLDVTPRLLALHSLEEYGEDAYALA